jgi:hypothetical protein
MKARAAARMSVPVWVLAVALSGLSLLLILPR